MFAETDPLVVEKLPNKLARHENFGLLIALGYLQSNGGLWNHGRFVLREYGLVRNATKGSDPVIINTS